VAYSSGRKIPVGEGREEVNDDVTTGNVGVDLCTVQ
jgi:hypothetical protein